MTRRAARSSRATTRSARCSPGRRAASFAATLRATPGIDAVGNAAAVHSSIAPVIKKTVKRPPAQASPLGGRRPAVVPRSGTWRRSMPRRRARSRPAAVGDRRPVRLGHRHHAPGSRGPGEGLGQRVAASAASPTRRRRSGRTTIRSATARSPPGSSAPRRTTSASSASRRMLRWRWSRSRIDDFNDPNVGLVFADAFVCAIDWAIGHDWDLIERQPHDRSVHRAGSTTSSAATSPTGPRSSRSSAARFSRRRATRRRSWRRPEPSRTSRTCRRDRRRHQLQA